MSFSKLYPHNIASGRHMQLKPGLNYWMDFKSTLVFKKKKSFLEGHPLWYCFLSQLHKRQKATRAYLLLQDRADSRGTMLWPPPPKLSSGIMIKTKPQLFIREVWEPFFFLWTSESCQCLCPPPSFSPSSHQLACLDLSHMVYSQRGAIRSGSKELLLSPVSLHRMPFIQQRFLSNCSVSL